MAGTPRTLLDIGPAGEEALVIGDAHPLRGLDGTLHDRATEALRQLLRRYLPACLTKGCGTAVRTDPAWLPR
ncbi:hypothetical protein GFH48_03035 [Streptomyces fagopyri]|uniref:Uncharacterized protein n=1 Tax=Streptomyces fagopyri TaxID=2662397 RepID=A0A5Q0L6Y4_9ACTN|nr:hypothetical protein [Streptomyces fagopyri]QFZ72369.1 hypothetical protein GFH48_03035 [Streptomyces fagopyri]